MKVIILAILFFVSFPVLAHKTSDSYINVTENDGAARISWEIALQDLVLFMDLDNDKDGSISWGELKENRTAIFSRTYSRITLTANDADCRPVLKSMNLSRHSDGNYIALTASLPCDITSDGFQFKYSFLFDLDAQHRGLLNVDIPGNSVAHVFSPDNQFFIYYVDEVSQTDSFISFFLEGVWHIWIGYDHILFLISLLLPATLSGRKSNDNGKGDFRAVFVSVIKIVTAFTIAHSITLTLVSLDVLSVPISLAETIIAISLVVAAGLNLMPKINIHRWQIGFVFGLIHGFGFASVLSELSIYGQSMLVPLAGFNLGVEAGQFAIVAVLCPLLFYFGQKKYYELVVVRAGSGLIMLLGVMWTIQRSV